HRAALSGRAIPLHYRAAHRRGGDVHQHRNQLSSAVRRTHVQWYRAIFAHSEFIHAARTSALVGTISAALGTVAAFLAAYALRRRGKRENVLLNAALVSPILVPQVVISLAMLQFAALFQLSGGLPSLIGVHTVYALPFALRLIMVGLVRFDFQS
ncbi:MAG: hypothetical protein WAN75_00335, partial [Xanthobacteraceae bacterium]